MDDAEIEDFIIGSGGTEGIEGQLIRLGSGRDYAGKLEMMKKADNMRKLDALDIDKMKPNAEGGRINFDKGGAARFREFIKDFDGQIYKGFVSDQADKFNIDRSTAADIIEALRSDIRKKLVERNYDVTKSQVEGGKSYADKIKERKVIRDYSLRWKI